jgi:hypothetical protein
MMKEQKTHLLLVFIMILIFICLSGCQEQNQQKNLVEHIELIDENVIIPPIAGEETIVIYTGTIENTADTTIEMVTIIAKFYDNNNTFLGSKTDTLNQISAGEQQQFKIQITNADPYYYEIDQVSYEFEI